MAVFTEVDPEDLEAFLVPYGLGRLLSFKGIAEGVENTNYLLHTEKNDYILTLFERRVPYQDLPYFVTLMNHLAARGIACPEPLRPEGGDPLGRLADRPAILVTFLEGMPVKRPSADHCRHVGRALAELHLAGSDCPLSRANSMGPAAWPDLYAPSAARADEVETGLAKLIEAEIGTLARDWPSGLPSGNIHADLFPDNVFFIAGELSGIIDFYFACTDFLLYDVAIALNAWCFEADGMLNVTKSRALLHGYEGVRQLTGEERAALPVLLRGAALRFLLTRLHDWLHHDDGVLVTPKDPREYAARLRFHAQASDIGALGLD